MSERFPSLMRGVVFVLAVGWVLHIGRQIFEPIIISVLVVYVIVGVARLTQRIPWLGPLMSVKLQYTLAILLIVLAVVGIASLIISNIARITLLAPKYQAGLIELIQKWFVILGGASEPTWDSLRRDIIGQINIHRVISSTLSSVKSIVGGAAVVLLYAVFLLIEKFNLPYKISNIAKEFPGAAIWERAIIDINDRIGTYLALKTFCSVLLGLISWAIMAWFGLEFAALWAILIALLNYVPYLGTFLGVLFPVAFSIVQFGQLEAAIKVAIALSVPQFFIGNFLDPYLMGNSLNLSPFAILVSLAVWGALWGITGAFCAVPITACIAMALSEFPETRPIAIMLSRNGDLGPALRSTAGPDG
ncbi:AI-2E family transporter [Dyella solisilvae]|uniref:AI-2E family transporter n=1 Tax=Dyella solisilvae TaxID=1920168 RepID=A0A370KAD2_9GAMM|nr:AI-2E family transporter [Dyella solisilvae]RDI99387.1 AI-2E family transporter [Dyella solisilvae]